MKDIAGRMKILGKFVLDSRFRRDYKAIKYAADGYIHYCIEKLEDLNVLEAIKGGATLTEICEETDIQHRKMLEHMLNALVSEDMLDYSDGVYSINEIEEPFSDKKYRWLEENYPASTEFTLFLLDYSEEVLKTGEPVDNTKFEGEAAELWDEMMDEFPYSFKKILLDRIFSDLEDGDRILDIGCGSGSLIEMVLRSIDKEVEIIGVDLSQEALDIAEERLQEMKELSESDLMRSNIGRVELRQGDLTESFPDGEYDYVIASLVFNHIPEESRKETTEKVADLLNSGGKFGVYQYIHPSKLNPLPFWMEHIVPTHEMHPYRDEFLPLFEKYFSDLTTYAEDTIIVAEK